MDREPPCALGATNAGAGEASRPLALASRIIAALEGFFSGGAFPVFALGAIALYQVALAGLILTPPADTGLGAFAEDFRIWCFGYDPATGRMSWGYAAGMFAPPWLVAGAIAWLWWAPLAALRHRPTATLRPLGAALALTAMAWGGFLLYGPRSTRGELPFPAEALRTSFAPPPLRLTDQNGATVDLRALRGKVVLLTAVYASCTNTCPMIMAETKSVVSELAPELRADLRVIAVTLDPGHDTRAVLADLAAAQHMEAPLYHLVTGSPPEVERTLDLMGISRRRDPKTGRIEHANLFLLLDRGGRVAYRFTLGLRQQRWLSTALPLLLGEVPDAG